MPNKALVVGINRYAKVKPLTVCVNSAKLVVASLPAYGFNHAFTRTLLDGQATTAGIVTGLKWLMSNLRKGDKVCFYFAGHGLRCAGPGSETEADGKNEALAPVDFDWSAKHMLQDKQLVTLLNALPKGCTMTVIFEACHSGGLNRAAPAVPPTLGGLTAPHTFIAACREEKVAAGTLLGGKLIGAFTYFLFESINRTTWPDIVARTNQKLLVLGLNQEAQLSGPLMGGEPFGGY